MLILICRIGSRLEYLPGACRISYHTCVSNEAFGDQIGLAGVDHGASGSAGIFHLWYHLPFFEENWISSLGGHLKANLVELLVLEYQ